MEAFILPLVGGSLIGIAVSMMLIFNGRVTGISGIISGLLKVTKQDILWRVTFVIGMFAGGLVLREWDPNVFANTSGRPTWMIALAGLLVGYGTVMGGGCTSGHGVCGISRMSIRSLLATVTFILFGVISATLTGIWLRG
jgi:uncharacterized membrane protein YedE/YeeE